MKRFVASKKLMGLFSGLLFLALGTSAQATLIQWKYDATISLRSGFTDHLGIDGETSSILLTFDDTDVWQQIGSYLYFPSVAATASITGGHTVALNTASPALVNQFNPVTAIADAFASSTFSYADLIIDGIQTEMYDFYAPITVVPAVGATLLPGHLPDFNSGSLVRIDYPIGSNPDYDLTNPSSSVSVIPEPATLLLLGSGLVGLVGFRRKFRK